MDANAEIRIWANIRGFEELTKGLGSNLLSVDEIKSLDRDDCRTFSRDFYTIDFKKDAIVCSLHTTLNAPVCRDSQLSISVAIPNGKQIENINTYFGKIKADLNRWANERKTDIEIGVYNESLRQLLEQLSAGIELKDSTIPFHTIQQVVGTAKAGVVLYDSSDQLDSLLKDTIRTEFIGYSTIFIASKEKSTYFQAATLITLSSLAEQKYRVFFPEYILDKPLCYISSEQEEINYKCHKDDYHDDILLKGTIKDYLKDGEIIKNDNDFSYTIKKTFSPKKKSYTVVVSPKEKEGYVQLADGIHGTLTSFNGERQLTFKGENIKTNISGSTFVYKSFSDDFSKIESVELEGDTITIKISTPKNEQSMPVIGGSGKRMGTQADNKTPERQSVTFVWSKQVRVNNDHPIEVRFGSNKKDFWGTEIKLDLLGGEELTFTLDGYDKIDYSYEQGKKQVFLDFERTTRYKFLHVIVPLIVSGLFLLCLGYTLGKYEFFPKPQTGPTQHQQDSAQIAQLNTLNNNQKNKIIQLNDSINRLNQTVGRLQSDLENKNKSTNRQLKIATAAIAKLNSPSFTQEDLKNAKGAASNAGIQERNQALFNACQQVLNFCTDKDGRKKSQDLLKQWVNGTWSTKGYFVDLPKDVKKPLQELVQNEESYKRYTQLAGSYSSLQKMINETKDQ